MCEKNGGCCGKCSCDSNTQPRLYVVVYEHDHGMNVDSYPSMEAVNAAQAEIARKYWDDRADSSAPNDHSALSDAEVIEAYFDNHFTDFWYVYDFDLPVDSKANAALELVGQIARLSTPEEEADGMIDLDDSHQCLVGLIAKACEILGETPREREEAAT